MKVGFVGPGKWGCKLANVFRSFGSEVVYHVRSEGNVEPVPGMGDLVSFADLVEAANAKMIDAIVCTATPEVTAHVYEACRDLAIPAISTKPLKLDGIVDRPPLVPTFVDYVRLWSPHYHAIKQDAQKAEISHVSVDFYGVGPYRGFSGLWDYGPHAAAFLFDLLGDHEVHVSSVKLIWNDKRGDYRTIEGTIGGVPFDMAVGNGSEEATSKKLSVKGVDGREWTYEEFGGVVRCEFPHKQVVDESPRALQLFVESFIEDVERKHVNLYTLWLTTKICRFLKEIESR